MNRINLPSFIFASQMGGYAMVLLDEVYAKWFGLFGLFPGIKNPAWFIHHQIDATLFAIPLVLPYVWNRLPGSGLVKGLIYGVIWHIFVVVVSIIGSVGGAEWFKNPIPMNVQVSTFILHLVWGGLTGLLYEPPERK
ncbi:hypothetical protein [Thermocrinis minervae]|uniref:Uncharacterized protein n=1 Tax=Thermocrinis minervae TaxID=381751 RepID=A0A1M6QRI6_9AQUI|nr:hypothetical protein [Thermocrinis minervae]SHK22909.1 hypothetical protein SAMN05444391_0363 [Thermocrinis minervae]